MSSSSSDLIRPVLPMVVPALLCFVFALGAVLGQLFINFEPFEYIIAFVGLAGIILFYVGLIKGANLIRHASPNKN